MCPTQVLILILLILILYWVTLKKEAFVDAVGDKSYVDRKSVV